MGRLREPNKSAQSDRLQSRPDPLSGVQQRSKSARTKTQPRNLRDTTTEIVEDPDEDVQMNYGDAPEALVDYTNSLYEPNTDSMSIVHVAGNNGTPAEDPPAAEATEEEIDDKTFRVCTAGIAYFIKQTEDGGARRPARATTTARLHREPATGTVRNLAPIPATRHVPPVHHVPRGSHAWATFLQEGQPVHHDRSQRHGQLP